MIPTLQGCYDSKTQQEYLEVPATHLVKAKYMFAIVLSLFS